MAEVKLRRQDDNGQRTQAARQEGGHGHFGDVPEEAAENRNPHPARVTDRKHPGRDPMDIVRFAQQRREGENENQQGRYGKPEDPRTDDDPSSRRKDNAEEADQHE